MESNNTYRNTKRFLQNMGLLVLVVIPWIIHGQTALYNSGNIRIHEEGAIGFHTNLINNSTFDQNMGLAGFYGTSGLIVSGAFAPIFFDSEIANENDLFLNTGIVVSNNFNFILGNVLTPRGDPSAFFNFIDDAFYVGESDENIIDGYAAITNKQNFIFPVGDFGHLRSLRLNSNGINTLATCAYFHEDPNSPTFFNTSFNTAVKVRDIENISTLEFWALQGSVTSRITVNWNAESNIPALTDTINAITLVGWNKSLNQWVILGNSAFGGDLNEGFITSASFVPDDYAIITFGSLGIASEVLTLDNFYLTPNGDGINDTLIIEELEASPNNSVRIFDRFGLKVFEQQNYTDQFDGTPNINNLVIKKEQGLPVGVYFYLVNLDDLGLEFQGFLYLNR